MAAAPLAAQEQTPRVLSLDEALEITLSGSPVIEASRYEEKAAQQERRAAIGLRMPQISVGGAYTYLGKDIGFDFNDLKGPVGNITHDILGSGLIPTELIPQIQQLLTPVMGAGLVPDIAGPQSRIRRRAGNPADLYGRQDQHGQPCPRKSMKKLPSNRETRVVTHWFRNS